MKISSPESYLNYALLFIRGMRQRHYWTKLMRQNLRNIVGERDLNKVQIQEIHDLYKGTPHFSMVFHQFYTNATGNFHADYMPDALYYQYIDPFFNDWEMAKYIDHKGLYRLMFPNAKQPKLLAYRMNGFWFDDAGCMMDFSEALSCIQSVKTCFIKQAVDSEGGHGIVFVDNSIVSNIELETTLFNLSFDVVVQEGLSQSKTLASINSSSVNTIRLLTLLRRDGTVKIYSVILRMGIGGAKVDNASSGGITVGVEDDGRLKSCAYSSKGERFDRHPTSLVRFCDFVIPNFEIVKQTVIDQAKNFPHFRLVSWDIALDDTDQPVVIEANLKFGEIDFHQLNNGSLFGDDTKDILDEVFTEYRKKYK